MGMDTCAGGLWGWVGGGTWVQCRQHNCRRLHSLLKRPACEHSGEHRAEEGRTAPNSSVSINNSELPSACNVLVIQDYQISTIEFQNNSKNKTNNKKQKRQHCLPLSITAVTKITIEIILPKIGWGALPSLLFPPSFFSYLHTPKKKTNSFYVNLTSSRWLGNSKPS